MKYFLPKGTFDILPEEPKQQESWKESARWHHLEKVAKELARDYCYREIRTPIFEQSDLFIRGVGESSDIVSKEMYLFQDKGGRSMSLRPEGTASVMRAFAEAQLQQLGSIHKFFYLGPFFRYDRPQAGRYRQFHQFGVEAIGVAGPESDFEAIEMLYEFYRRLKLQDLQVMINTLGDKECREKYQASLLNFLKPHFNRLSEESKLRFSKNPLRILDTKDPEEKHLLQQAPSILDFLSQDDKTSFESLCFLLKSEGIPFKVTPTLVRGLDYYNQVVFELTSNVLGAQNTIGAGGRYDGLLPSIGGADLPCIGFSTGLERILQTMEGQGLSFPEARGPTVVILPLGEKPKEPAFKLLYALRHAHISAEMIAAKKVQKGIQQASKLKGRYVIVIGLDELEKERVEIKEMDNRTSQSVSLSQVVEYLKERNEHGL